MSGYWLVAVLSYILMALAGVVNFSKWGNTWLEKLINILADCIGISICWEPGRSGERGGIWGLRSFYCDTACNGLLFEKGWRWTVCYVPFLLPRVFGLGYMGGRNAYSFLMIFCLV